MPSKLLSISVCPSSNRVCAVSRYSQCVDAVGQKSDLDLDGEIRPDWEKAR